MSSSPRSTLAALALVVAAASTSARADDDPGERPGAAEPCPDWCGREPAWVTAVSGTGPETSAETQLSLGTASRTRTVGAGAGDTVETAAVVGVEVRFPLARKDSSRGFDSRIVRARVVGQVLGWRLAPASAARAATTDDADLGASLGLGYTGTLVWWSRHSKLAATVDLEGATGLDVAHGLGLHADGTGARAVGAAGLALGLDGRVGGLRAHARGLRALAGAPGWSSAIEVGVGLATRFDWPRFDGPWPIEVWVDLGERRRLGADAGERELTTGVDYVPGRGFTRLGLRAVVRDEWGADGTSARDRVLLVRFDRPFGGL